VPFSCQDKNNDFLKTFRQNAQMSHDAHTDSQYYAAGQTCP
jgi:hypothetical protein